MINLILLGLLVLFVGFGVLGGLIKGLGKARIRGICVIACAIAAVVLTVLARKFIVDDAWISRLMAEIGNTEMIDTIMAVSPSLATIVLNCAASLVAPILCLAFYIVLSFVSWIVYLIVTLILHKALREHNKRCKYRKLRACAWGAVKGFVVFLMLMLPVAAYLDVAAPVLDTVIQAEIMDESDTATLKQIKTDYLDPANNGTLKVYRVLGGNLVIDSITNFKVNDQKVDFSKEVGTLASLGCNAMQLTKNEMSQFGSAEAEAINGVANSFDQSVLLPTIAGEMIYGATDSWINGQEFLGAAKPNMGNEIFDPFMDSLIEILHEDSRNHPALQADVHTVASIVGTFAEHQVFANISDMNALMTSLSSNGIVNKMVETLGANNSMKRLIPEITNMGVRAIATSLGISADITEEYNGLLNDVVDSVNAAKAMPEDQRAAYLTGALKTAFDEAGVPVDEEIMACYSVSMIEDFINDADGARITTNDVQAFFEIYAVNAVTPDDADQNDTNPVAMQGTLVLGNGDKYANTVYAGKSEEELKTTGAGVLSVVYVALGNIDAAEGDEYAAASLRYVATTYQSYMTLTTSSLDELNKLNLRTKPSEDSYKAAASLKQPETMITTKILLTDLLINTKDVAGRLDAQAIAAEINVINSIFNAASSLLSSGDMSDLDIETLTGTVGEILDALNTSVSYGGDMTANLLTAIMQSETVRDVANIDVKTATMIAQKATEGNPNYTQTMTLVSSTVTIMTNYNNANQEISEDDLIKLIQNINPQNAGVLEVFATPERLESYNVPAQYAGLSAELLSGTFHHMATAEMTEEQYANEAKALNQILSIALTARENTTANHLFTKGDQAGVLPSTATETVEIFMSSHAIGAAIRGAMLNEDGTVRADRYDAFGLGANLPTNSTDRTDCENAIKAFYANPANQTEENKLTLRAIAALLGVSDSIVFG